MVGAIVDLYHTDRALHAASLFSGVEPIRYADISVQRDIRELKKWAPGTPYVILPHVVRVIEEETPDKMIIVDCAEETRHISTGIDIDPVIYACYGPWCVKIVEVK